jgi:hypothetical protein
MSHVRPRHYSVVAKLTPDADPIEYCHHGPGQHSHRFASWCKYWRNFWDREPSMPTMRWYVQNERKL